jgi:anti-sigma regulatory factor (Ser/Thr protein kinase)
MSETQTNRGNEQPTLRLTLLSDPDNIAVIRQALAGLATELGAAPDLVDDIKTAVSEAVTNAVVHGYPEGTGPIDVTAVTADRRLDIVVADRGTGIQPRPVSEGEPSLRVGLALIGALADEFQVRGEAGAGTEVRISFDLDRVPGDGDRERLAMPDATPRESEALIAVRSAEPGGAAIPKVLEMLVARSDLGLDRLSDAQLIGDFLAKWSSDATVDSKPLEVAISDEQGGVQIRVGPLDPGVGDKMLKRSELPGLGNTLERITDRAEVSQAETDAGQAEFLLLELRSV